MAARVAVLHSILHWGSTEWYLRDLFERVDPDEFELWLVCPDDPVLEPLRAVEAIRGRVLALPTAAYGDARHAIAAERRALRTVRPDLVHVSDVDPAALLASRLAGTRRVLVTYHTPEHRPGFNVAGRLLRRLGWATKPHVVFTSEPDRETALARDPIARERTSVIPFGLHLERFTPGTEDRLRPELGLDGDSRIVGTVGLLRRQKGHEVLVRAAELVLREEPETVFVVVGGGELRDELEALARAAGLGRRFLLLGGRDDVPGLLAGFDVFALSSHFEGMCFAVAEALAMEKPVVATAVGGVRQSVVDGETGLLVPPGDPSALAEKLVWALRHPDEARRLGVAGRKRVTELYGLDRMVAETSELYRRLLRS